ncbi:MAG: carbohydrate ABC transporter permease [Lachnospiraceae bacterium]|nr:carbohydrate ABC transporter permease [Lachnospiraceae bacterium]
MKSSKSKALNNVFTVILSILSLAYVYPVFMILINSLKQELSITTESAFVLPTAETFAGLENYVSAIQAQGFMKSLGFSLFITVSSVAAILLFCSMSAWYIARINSVFSNVFYYLCVFSMVVPFQMVMYTLSSTADTLKLNTPWNIWVIYLGFGAGLAVFMITGFMKGIPLEIEEAAMIDGCTPIQTFFSIVLPMLKPTLVSVGILQAMWVWNDYLLPTLVLDIKKYKTIPMLIQYFRGSYGRVEMGPMMACIMLTIIPIIIVYLAGQKHIIKGVAAGAVKG